MWYVIQVYTGKEQEIAERCRKQIIKPGEDVFVMIGEKKYRIKGRWKLDYYRLFAGYVFVETEDIKNFYIRLQEIEGMAKVLCTGGELTPLHPEEEAYLRRLGGKEHIVRYSEGYLSGEKLVVLSGALTGYEGRIRKLDRHHRKVFIEVPLLGRTVEVELGLEIVRKTEE